MKRRADYRDLPDEGASTCSMLVDTAFGVKDPRGIGRPALNLVLKSSIVRNWSAGGRAGCA